MTQVQKAAGTLDPAFGTNGVVTLPFNGVVGSVPVAVLPQPDKKLLIAIATTQPQNAPAKIARLEENGSLDLKFGTGGIVEIPFDEGTWFSPRHLHPLTNEGWLITGTAEREAEPGVDLALVRLLEDGELDTTFGEDGKVTLNIYDLIESPAGANIRFLTRRHDKERGDSLADSAGDMGATTIVQRDGKIVLFGTIFFEYNNLQGIVIRLNENGSLDTSFNHKGFLLVELPGIEHVWNYASGVAVQQDGKVLVCGDFSNAPDDEYPDAYVIRYDQSGNIDGEYGDKKNGVVIVADPQKGLALGSMSLKPDGGLIATGSAFWRRLPDGLIVSLNASGSFNLVFNNGKPLLSDFLDEGVSWRRSILQEDGKIIVMGQGGGLFIDENSSMVTARYLADGSRDRTFGDNGWVVFNDEKGIDLYRGGAQMSENRVVVCGYAINPPNPLRGSVVRYLG